MATFLIVYKFLLCICYSMEEEKQYKKQPTEKKKECYFYVVYNSVYFDYF